MGTTESIECLFKMPFPFFFCSQIAYHLAVMSDACEVCWLRWQEGGMPPMSELLKVVFCSCGFSFLKQLDSFKGLLCCSGHQGRVLGHSDDQIWQNAHQQLFSWLGYTL